MLEKASIFIGEVKTELRKATWPWDNNPNVKGVDKYRELISSTLVVLIAIVLLAAFVALSDTISQTVISKIFEISTAK